VRELFHSVTAGWAQSGLFETNPRYASKIIDIRTDISYVTRVESAGMGSPLTLTSFVADRLFFMRRSIGRLIHQQIAAKETDCESVQRNGTAFAC
jgi:hypothetical protein